MTAIHQVLGQPGNLQVARTPVELLTGQALDHLPPLIDDKRKGAVKKICTNSHKKRNFFVAVGANFFHRPLQAPTTPPMDTGSSWCQPL